MDKYKFPCGCEFTITDEKIKYSDGLPSLDVDFYNLPLTCPKVWELLQEGKTKGIFQLETNLGRAWARRILPDNVEDLAALISVVRPGTLKVKVNNKSMTQLFADRKRGEEKTIDVHPAIHDILAKTHQILVYQEQSLKIAQKVAGFDLKQADVLRRAIGKKIPELMTKVENDFVEGVKKTGIVTEEEGKEIWGYIRKSERYSFNASHAVSYAILGAWTAYIKYHFPLQFYTAWLTFAKEKIDPQKEVRELVRDAKSNGIDICVPSILNIHNGLDFILKEKRIYFGIRSIKRIGDAQVKKLSEEVKKKEILLDKTLDKWNWLDFLVYLTPDISKTVVNNLIMVGALDHFDLKRQEMLNDYSVWSELTEKEQLYVQANIGCNLKDCIKNLEKNPKISKNRLQIVNGLGIILQNPTSAHDDNLTWVNKIEEDLLGVAVSTQRLDTCDIIDADTTCKEFSDGKSGEVTLCVEIRDVREHKVKSGSSKGQSMAFLNIEDESGILESVVLFSDKWEEFQNMLYAGNTVAVSGYKSKKDSLVIQKVRQL